jgi:hypothetical protein
MYSEPYSWAEVEERRIAKMAMPPAKASSGITDDDFLRLEKEYAFLRYDVRTGRRIEPPLEEIVF